MNTSATTSAGMRITELAARAGVSVRTVRFYHQAGVLPRPRMRGRVGWYGQEHLERLAFVRRLQERGYSLAAVADMVAAQVPDGLTAGAPLRVTRQELELMVPPLAGRPELVDGDLVRLGVLRRVGEVGPDHGDAYEVAQPALLRAGVALVARGVPVEVALAQLDRLRAELGAIAERFALILRRDLLPGYLLRHEPGDAPREVLEEVLPAILVATGSVLREALERAVSRPASAGSPS